MNQTPSQIEIIKSNLNGWQITKVYNSEITDDDRRNEPRLFIDFSEMSINGSDGCNRFFGQLKSISDSTIEIGQLASTKMMCPNMELSDQIHKALKEQKTYKITENQFVLLDSDGNTILTLRPLSGAK